ncbi:MAG: BTAD domain-containing putative transcriptional regulator, partial [Longimicrobiales bacterium]
MFRLKLFGSASIEGPGGPLTGRAVQRRRLGLLALLAVAGRRGLTRDKLIGYLWPDANPDRARHLLSDSVYRINQAVGGDALIATGDELRLNPLRLPSDAWEFAEALERGDWKHAVDLHAAPFLDGFFLTDADELERWVDAQRERLARERARALEALAHAAEHDDAHSEAARWWRLLAEQDPLSSRIALRLMRALDRTGDRAAALRLARSHTLLLHEELGVAPDADLIAFAAALRTPPPRTPPAGTPAPHTPAPGPRATPASAAMTPSAVPEAEPSQRMVEQDSVSDDMADGDMADRDMADRDMADRDMADRDMPDRDMPDRDMPDRDMARWDMPDPDSAAIGDHDRAPPRSPRRTRHIAAVGLGLVLLVIAAIVSRQGVRVRADADAPAIAVLPFADLSADGEYEYFADGITEELMVRLAQVDGLSVVGRTSAFALKGRDLDVREIAARLNVTTVLEGSVRHSGESLRIVAQLIDARNGYQLWTETYDREIEDVFAIQEEIARQIVARLGRRLTGADESRLADRVGATDDPEAFNLYLKGRYEWHRRTEQSLLSAAAFF